MENFQVVVEHSIQIMVQSNLLIGLSHSPRTADAPGQPSRMKANTGRLALTAISESPAVTASVWTALWRLVPCLFNWFCECKHFSYRGLGHFLRWKEYSFTAWIVWMWKQDAPTVRRLDVNHQVHASCSPPSSNLAQWIIKEIFLWPSEILMSTEGWFVLSSLVFFFPYSFCPFVSPSLIFLSLFLPIFVFLY